MFILREEKRIGRFADKGRPGKQGYYLSLCLHVGMVGLLLLVVDVGLLDVGREAAGERFVSPSESGRGRRR